MLKRSAINLCLVSTLLLTGCSGMSSSSSLSGSRQASVESYSQLGIRYLQAGDTVSAKSSLQRALEIDGDYAPALNGLGLVFQAEQEPALAEEYFKKAVSADPNSAMVHNNYGAFLYSQRRYEEACTELSRATEDPFYPQRAQAFENLGLCYRLINNDSAAEFVLNRALTLSPDRPLSMVELADIRLDKGDFRTSAELFNRFRDLVDAGRVEHSSKSLWVGIRLARQQGSASRAVTYALLLKNQYPNSEEYKKYMESGR